MMVLGGAFVIPNVLRWYWWRFNGVGYAAGTLVGLAGAMPLLFVADGHSNRRFTSRSPRCAGLADGFRDREPIVVDNRQRSPC